MSGFHHKRPVKTSITLPQDLLDQASTLAQQLHLSRNQLFQLAIEQFIERVQHPFNPVDLSAASDMPAAAPPTRPPPVNQGDVYWLPSDEPQSEIPHPHVVIQDNLLNHSRLATVVVCAVTSNLKRASYPGNVRLEAHEANLPRPSVVEISKVSAVAKTQLGAYIGSLDDARIAQILAGIRFQQTSFFNKD